MTSTLTGIRQQLAAAVTVQVGDGTAVWAAVPSNLTAPAVAVVLDGGARQAGCLWSVRWRLLCVAPGGDNDAAITALEAMITAVVVAMETVPGALLTWEPPEQVMSAGVPYLTQAVNVEIPVEVKVAA